MQDEHRFEDVNGKKLSPVALFWELLSQEELKAEEGREINEHAFHVVGVGHDILVFECHGRRTLCRHYFAAENCWKTQSLKMKNGSHISLHAAAVSPMNPKVVYILHCSTDWNSDRRYEIFTFDSDTNEIEPQANLLDDVSIAPKKRHGFSIAPCRFDVDPVFVRQCSAQSGYNEGAPSAKSVVENENDVEWSDHFIYFMCGLQHFPGDATGSFVYCFSPESKTWSQVDYTGDFPAPDSDLPYVGCRFGQSCIVYDNRAWLFGGCVKGDYGMEPTNDFFTFHLLDHHWEQVMANGDLQPPALSGHVALVCQDHMFIFTCESSSMEVYAFDMIALTWELLPEILLGPRLIDGRIFWCISGERLIAYQQIQDEATQQRRHELFSLDVGEALQALRQSGPPGMHPKSRQELDLLGDEATADVAFAIEGRSVVAHKKVLQRLCPALAAMCEPSTTSMSTKIGERCLPSTRLDNVKYSAFCLMLEHIYSRFTKQLQPVDAENLLELAQQFELTTLVQRCQDSVAIDASNVRRFLDLAQNWTGMEVLNRKCVGYLIAHPEHLSMVSKGPVKSFSGSGSVSPEQTPLAPVPLKWNPLEAAVAVARPNLGIAYPPIVPPAPTRAVVLPDPSAARQVDPAYPSYPLDRYVMTAPPYKPVAMPPSVLPHGSMRDSLTPGTAPQGQLAGPARHPSHKASPHIVQREAQYWYPPYYGQMPSR